jgi:hypothetical protein
MEDYQEPTGDWSRLAQEEPVKETSVQEGPISELPT